MKRYSSVLGGFLRVAVLVIGLVAVAGLASEAAADAIVVEAVAGVASVEAYSEPGYEGYWRYCIDITWSTSGLGGKGMSFVNFFLDLGDCPCACDPGIVMFPEVVGTGIGENGCDLSFVGIYDCRGDPHFPERGPSIKFESACGDCEPGPRGMARVCFYSMFEPGGGGSYRDALGIKSSVETVTGDLVGTFPVCLCGSPVESSSWGVVKGLYR